MMIPNRGILALSGADSVSFLNNLITNDIGGLEDGHAAYACLLTPQGRFLHDFFVIRDGERLLLDCEADRRDDLAQRLKRFRLRAAVEIADETAVYSIHYHSREGGSPETVGLAFADPRDLRLGFRVLLKSEPDSRLRGNDNQFETWDRLRISLGVPDGSRDMVPEQALLLENNIDRLHGISWTKGCYIGQELTARMHYKGGVKRLLTPVVFDESSAEAGTPITHYGEVVGEMRSSCGDIGLALLRVDAEASELRAGEAKLSGYTPNDMD